MGLGTVALAATLCTGAVAAVGGDNARLTAADAVAAEALAPVAHPGQAPKLSAASERVRASRTSDVLSWPLRGAVTGRFGESRGGHEHAGIDIPMPSGTPIRAASGGTVVMREMQDGYGKYTCVAHETITTCYAHQSRFRAKLGDRVTRGEVIGYVGNTGNSAAIHLHFEVRRGTEPWGAPVDPAKYLPPS